MNYDLKTPCKDCPFLVSREFPLHPERAEQICDTLRTGGTFACHKTVDYSGDAARVLKKSQHCAGALIMLAKMDELYANQMAWIAHRLGLFDPDALDLDADVYDDDESMVDAMIELNTRGG